MAPSFDITPKKPAPRKQAVRDTAPRPAVRAPRPGYVRPVMRTQSEPPPRQQARKGGMPLKARRRARRKRLVLLIFILILILAAVADIVLWQSPLRITSVTASGAHQSDMPEFVRGKLSGTVYGIIPRDSIFFIPREELRTAILEAFPDIEAVSLAPSGLTTLTVSSIGRASSFWWCGTDHAVQNVTCYDADTSGKIFREATLQQATASTTASSTAPVSDTGNTPFAVYGAYQGGSETSPVGGVLGNASKLPDMFRFVKSLKELGANVISAQIRDDEADLYTASGTRITYVLGHEQEALTLAATAFPDLDVSGNSLLYIDLRFSSKIYYKKRNSP